MVTYKYTALSNSGQKVNGVIDAFNEMDAVDRIKQNHSVIIKLTPTKGDGEGFLNMEIGGNKLNNKAFIVMCSQFAIILGAGIPIGRTVQLIAQKTTDKPLKRMLTHVAEDVEAGRSISSSFAERGEKLLPSTFVETIAAGEQSGNLDKAFQTVHEHFDKQAKMAAKVRGALAYPVFVLFIAVAVVVVLMVKVVPTFLAIFDSYDAELPLPTRILIAISNFFVKWWMPMLGVIIVFHRLQALQQHGGGAHEPCQVGAQGACPRQYPDPQRRQRVCQHHGHDALLRPAHDPAPSPSPRKTMSNYFMSHRGGQARRQAGGGPRPRRTSMREADCMPGHPGGHGRRGRGDRRRWSRP